MSPESRSSRYQSIRAIASGGMATVHLARLVGPGGFARSVAIKRPHEHLARNPEFRAMLLDEGRIAALVRHPNVVTTLDVVEEEDDLFLVMEYVPGRTLAEIQRALRSRGESMPVPIACGIVHGALLGLAAVHATCDENGAPLDIVHRDVSPQNILVGHDGVPRILDFGVAKACGRLQITREGQVKGKVAYMAPEQMRGHASARTDVHAAAIVLWEALAGRRLWSGQDDIETFSKVLTQVVEPPSRARGHAESGIDWARLDACVLRGLARDPEARFASAKEMADAIASAVAIAPAASVQAWLARDGEAPVESDAAATTPDAPQPATGVTLTDTADGAALVAREELPTPRRRSMRNAAISALILSALGLVLAMRETDHAAAAPAIESPLPVPTAAPSQPIHTDQDAVTARPATDPPPPPAAAAPASRPAPTVASHAKPRPKPHSEPAPRSPAVDVNRVLDARH